MEEDFYREKLEVKMFCSKHPKNELKFSTDSRIGASSAYEINAKILIHPCSMCRMEIESIENAVSVLMSLNKD